MARPFKWPKSYTHFVVVRAPSGTACIESGWEFREDAVDQRRELRRGLPNGFVAKVQARRSILDFAPGAACTGWPPHRADGK